MTLYLNQEHQNNNNDNLLISNTQVSTIGFSNARYKEQNVYKLYKLGIIWVERI